MNKKSRSRMRITLTSWGHNALNGIIAGCIVLVGAYAFRCYITELIQIPEWVFLALAACLLIIALLNFRKTLAFLGVWRPFVMPPFWLSSFISIASLCYTFTWFQGYLPATFQGAQLRQDLAIAGGMLIRCYLLYLSLSVIWVVLHSHKKSPTTNSSSAVTKLETAPYETISNWSFGQIRTWFESDSAIEDKSQDVFGHAVIAHRIVRRIIENQSMIPSQALIGRLGSGKTTIMNLVKKEISREKSAANVRIVSVELWPFATTEAAVIGIIRAIIDELSKEVNTLGLRSLPDSYIQAANAVSGLWGVIAHILYGTPKNPIDTLRNIGATLESANLRYIVWIEDLERFSGQRSNSHDVVESPEESERLNPIRSLLYGLNTLPNLRVIVATTTLNKRFDLEKIVRFVERIPSLPVEPLSKLIGRFRESCLSDKSFIDPSEPKQRAKMDIKDPTHRSVLVDMFGQKYSDISLVIFALSRTPRALKSGLRRCSEFWERYKGEIDFDDLLLMCLIRESEPELLSIIEKHMDGLRSGSGETKDYACKAFFEDARQLKLENLNEEDIKEIKEFIFDVSPKAKPQGIARREPVDYFARFLAEPDIEETYSDQSVIKILASRNETDIVNGLQDKNKVRLIEHFESMLSDDVLISLIAPLVQQLATQPSIHWREDMPTGLVELWRMLLSRVRSGRDLKQGVLESLRTLVPQVMPKNLELADDIKHYFIDAFEDSKDGLLSTADGVYHQEATQLLQANLIAAFTGKPKVFADAAKGGSPWSLYRLLHLIASKGNQVSPQVPFSGWRGLAKTILEAGKLYPAAALPQIAGIVTQGSSSLGHEGRRDDYSFKEELAVFFFKDAANVKSLFMSVDLSLWDDPRIKAMVQAIKNAPNASL